MRRTFRLARRAGVELLRSIEREFAPKRCVFCDVPTEQPERFVCKGCDTDLPRIGTACSGCALPVAVELPPGVRCAACQSAPPLWSRAVAPLEYAFPVDAAIKAMKFRRRLDYLPAFDDILAVAELPEDIDAVVPVPLHRWRQLRRGFNQAEELARPVARRLGVPLRNDVRRCRPTDSQSGLDAASRRRNLKEAFRVAGPLPMNHALLVDDVITTGETLRGVTKVLLEAGVEKVSVLALARSV
ncbi:MAG: ComF family protein [Woeseiaceae bacterium]|nr:ComF family protein [Woeseiaceae bacterium]